MTENNGSETLCKRVQVGVGCAGGGNWLMDPDEPQEQVAEYEPPRITEVGEFGEVAKGQYSRNRSDDGDAGGYFPG